MKVIVKILTHVAAFGAGLAAGYFFRKRSELKIEEVTEDELQKIANNGTQDGFKAPSEPQEAVSGIDIEEEINKVFKREEEAKESEKEGIGEGQKIAYFKKWKEDASEQYDTRTQSDPDDIVVGEIEEGLDQEFLNEIERDVANLPDIEPATIEDWNHWLSKVDGQYEPIELYWYSRDDILTDTREEEVERKELFVGFDIGKIFQQTDAETTGDDNVRIVFNNRHGIIYHITRINGSWALKKKAEEFGGDEDDNEEDDYERWSGDGKIHHVGQL